MSAAAVEVAGTKWAFPCLDVTQTGGNRIVPRERPYRDGAKLDDTGSKAITWQLTAVFNNSVIEPGVTDVNGDIPLYPDVLANLITLADTHETGIVTIPTIGEQPARLADYSRKEKFDERSQAVLTLTFIEDNEDSVDFARLVELPSVDANAKYVADTTTFSFQSDANWDQFVADLETSSNQLEDLANSPQSVKRDIDATNERLKQTGAKVTRIGMDNATPGKGAFIGPGGNSSERKLAQMLGMSARATNDARRGRPRVITVVTKRNTTLSAVAADTNQDFIDLLEINPELSPFFIPANTRVKIYADTGNVR